MLRVGPANTGPVTQTIATNSTNSTQIRLQTVPATVSRFTGPPLALRKTIVRSSSTSSTSTTKSTTHHQQQQQHSQQQQQQHHHHHQQQQQHQQLHQQATASTLKQIKQNVNVSSKKSQEIDKTELILNSLYLTILYFI